MFAKIDYECRRIACHVLVRIGMFLTAIAAGFIRAGAWIVDIEVEGL
jgi:hypothetical protein